MANPEHELAKLEREFTKLQEKRAPSVILRNLGAGKKWLVSSRQVSKESQQHAAVTKKLLTIIDRYAALHTRARKGNIVLPVKMARELEKLSRRETVRLHPGLSPAIARAMSAHRNRLMDIFGKAEELRVKHKLTIAAAGILGT